MFDWFSAAAVCSQITTCWSVMYSRRSVQGYSVKALMWDNHVKDLTARKGHLTINLLRDHLWESNSFPVWWLWLSIDTLLLCCSFFLFLLLISQMFWLVLGFLSQIFLKFPLAICKQIYICYIFAVFLIFNSFFLLSLVIALFRTHLYMFLSASNAYIVVHVNHKSKLTVSLGSEPWVLIAQYGFSSM